MSKQTEDALSKSGMERPLNQGNADVKTEDLREEVIADPKLLTSVEDRLKNLGDLTWTPRTGKNPAAELEDEDEAEADDIAAKDTGESAKDKSDDSDSPPLDKDGKQFLPEAYVRTAIGFGWKEDDVYEFFNKDPERALTTFSNIYQTRNRASAEFAAIGRRRTEEVKPKEGEETPKFKLVDTAKLKEQYGDEAKPLIEMIEAQNATLNQLAERLPKPVEKRQDRTFESAVEESGVEQQIHSFFTADQMKPWEKIYGKLGFGETWEDLTPGQREMRQRLLVKADQIVGGAHLQHVDMKLEEALEHAHLLVTQKYRDEVLIDSIKKQVVQRSKAISVQPSKTARKPGKEVTDEVKPGTRTKEQLVNDTQRKLNKLYGQS
jgi:hypothetical protein